MLHAGHVRHSLKKRIITLQTGGDLHLVNDCDYSGDAHHFFSHSRVPVWTTTLAKDNCWMSPSRRRSSWRLPGNCLGPIGRKIWALASEPWHCVSQFWVYEAKVQFLKLCLALVIELVCFCCEYTLLASLRNLFWLCEGDKTIQKDFKQITKPWRYKE